MALSKSQQDLLKKFGARQIRSREQFSLQLSSQGKRNTGKTHFAMTGREPILHINIDLGTDDVEDRIIDTFGKKDIAVLTITPEQYKDEADNKKSHLDAYYQAKEAVTEACKDGFKNIILDTADEMWKIFRIGYFNTDRGVAQLKYEIPNQMFSHFLRIPQTYGVDFVATHRVSNVWKSEDGTKADGTAVTRRVKTDELEREGFQHTDYIFRVDIEHINRMMPGGTGLDFGIRILRCTANSELYGMDIWQSELGEPLTMKVLGQMVYPKSKPEDWE